MSEPQKPFLTNLELVNGVYLLQAGDRVETKKAPNYANQPFKVDAVIIPNGKDGVLVSHGGKQQGYSLYLEKGNVVFVTKVDGKATAIKTEKPLLNELVVVQGRVKKDGLLTIAINGLVSAEGKSPGLIPKMPIDPLEVGQDSLSRVGTYPEKNAYSGKIEEVRITIGK